MRQKSSLKPFLLPKTTEKIGTPYAIKNITMWYNNQTIRYTYKPSDKEIVFNFELPGKSKEDVKVYFNENLLNVKVKEKDTFYIDLEQYSSYLKGHQDYDVSSTKAKMEHGMLSVNIPRKKQEQKLIEIT